MTQLTVEQITSLLGGIDKNRVRYLRGMAHVESWDVRRHLIRIFGFDGFDIETKALALIREIECPPGSFTIKDGSPNGSPNKHTAWTVIYRAEVRLTIKVNGKAIAVFEDAAAGDGCHQPSLGDAHDMAMKTALSQALKRCAVNLGDQFGLGLYNNGSVQPTVLGSLVLPNPTPDSNGPTNTSVIPLNSGPIGGELISQNDMGSPEDMHYTMGMRYTILAAAIKDAPTLEDLKSWWVRISPALEDREITQGEADCLIQAVRDRKAILAPAPPDDVAAAEVDQAELDKRRREMFALFAEVNMTDRNDQLSYLSLLTQREIISRKDLTMDEIIRAVAGLRNMIHTNPD